MADILDDPKASRFFYTMASELEESHKGLDIERVVTILARTVRDAHGPLFGWPKVEEPAGSKLILLPNLWFSPDIGEALRYLPEEGASTIRESQPGGAAHSPAVHQLPGLEGRAPLHRQAALINTISASSNTSVHQYE